MVCQALNNHDMVIEIIVQHNDMYLIISMWNKVKELKKIEWQIKHILVKCMRGEKRKL